MANTENMIQSMETAFHDAVAKMYQAVLKGEQKVDEFVKQYHKALEEHDKAKAAVTAGGPRESDDDYRKRLMPIAGDDTWKQRIEQSNGEALDKLGEHYNVARSVTPPQREGQPKDEADRAENLASRNQAPENGTTKEPAKSAAPASASVLTASASASQDQDIQRRISNDTASDRDGDKLAAANAKKD